LRTIPISMPSNAKIERDTLQRRGVCLHASAVSVSGRALLFLGHSTAGKSTISHLLSERYPVIADDKVRAWQKKNGDWMISDGSTDFQSKGKNMISTGSRKKYPLLAVLRIFKAKTMTIKPLSPRRTCRYLIDAVFEVDGQRDHKDLKTIKKWFSYTVVISKKNMGWGLTFRKDKSIMKLIHDVFEENEV